MEGLGYWIFLAVLYLLSALMKKRQQQAARRKLDQEEASSTPREKPNPLQAEFLQDLFGDVKELVKEPKEEVGDEFADFKVVKTEPVPEPKPVHIPIEHDHVVFEDLSEPEPEPIHAEYQFWKKKRKEKRPLGPLFRSMNDLKRGIVLKEILDKPRAMRRSIR